MVLDVNSMRAMNHAISAANSAGWTTRVIAIVTWIVIIPIVIRLGFVFSMILDFLLANVFQDTLVRDAQ